MDETTTDHLFELGIPEPALDAIAYCEVIEENKGTLTPIEAALLSGIRVLILKTEQLTKELEVI